MVKDKKLAYSTINSFLTCERQYYFGHVLASHGRKNLYRREAFELKQVVDFKMWQGKVVDLILEKLIKGKIKNSSIDYNVIADEAVELAKQQFEFSLSKEYKKPKVNKTGNDRFQIIDVHKLGKPYEASELEDVYQNIRKAVLNFPKIKVPDEDMLLVNFVKTAHISAPNVTDRKFSYQGMYVSPQIDLLLYRDYKPVVIDWKLAESDYSDYSRQLVIIGLTLYMDKLAKCPEESGREPFDYEDIRLYEVNLLKAEMIQHEFNANIAQDMLDKMYLTSGDLSLFRQDKAWSDFSINDLEWAKNDNACQSCNFKTLCGFLFENNNEYDEETYQQFVQNTKFIQN